MLLFLEPPFTNCVGFGMHHLRNAYVGGTDTCSMYCLELDGMQAAHPTRWKPAHLLTNSLGSKKSCNVAE